MMRISLLLVLLSIFCSVNAFPHEEIKKLSYLRDFNEINEQRYNEDYFKKEDVIALRDFMKNPYGKRKAFKFQIIDL